MRALFSRALRPRADTAGGVRAADEPTDPWPIRAIAVLPADERGVLEHVLLARVTLDQAAADHDLSVTDAAVRITRALRRLASETKTAAARQSGQRGLPSI